MQIRINSPLKKEISEELIETLDRSEKKFYFLSNILAAAYSGTKLREKCDERCPKIVKIHSGN